MIDQTLKQLGLKEKEVQIYLEIMRFGRTTPARVALTTGINRATVYSVVKILLQKGLIQEDIGGAIRYVVALPPKDLEVLIRKERQKIAKKEDLVEKAIKELEDLPLNTQYSVPQVRFIEEENLQDYLHSSVENWEKSMRKTDETNTWWGFQDVSFVEYFEDWITWYWSRAPEDTRLKLLSNEKEAERQMERYTIDQRVIKFWDKQTDFTATTWLLGEYLVFIYTQEKPLYAIEIHNPVMAHNYREVFKNIWNKY